MQAERVTGVVERGCWRDMDVLAATTLPPPPPPPPPPCSSSSALGSSSSRALLAAALCSVRPWPTCVARVGYDGGDSLHQRREGGGGGRHWLRERGSASLPLPFHFGSGSHGGKRPRHPGHHTHHAHGDWGRRRWPAPAQRGRRRWLAPVQRGRRREFAPSVLLRFWEPQRRTASVPRPPHPRMGPPASSGRLGGTAWRGRRRRAWPAARSQPTARMAVGAVGHGGMHGRSREPAGGANGCGHNAMRGGAEGIKGGRAR
ncbi:hypothetical protein PVAP13_1KG328605 [Panicum virgatum]|uniref:Uncharacterized protein n=1 Tax=Panicum virgatum TaxID=38727 RepID=A0A8T0XG50_PANVG|nr:hypothetical protein PVAP13_1KG328605 [Panicum virgatum]